jgi:hypothetical protein
VSVTDLFGPDPYEPTESEAQAYYGEQMASLNGDGRHVEPLAFAQLEEFVSVEEPTAEPLLGTKAETILPADGMLLMYGDGGAGKTTLTIDAVFHLASGMRWLKQDVERPVRTLLIENEGPRGKFRQMLAEKTMAWSREVNGNVAVLEEPWTRFSLREPEHRAQLAGYVDEGEIDLVVMGPLVTLGMVGGGTPDEVSAFEWLLGETRSLATRKFAFWIVHHENKAGDVSGAWERVPDTLCHVQARGNGHTTLVWRKACWSSECHGTSIDLTWEEGRSFALVEKVERDPYAEMLEAFEEKDEWRTAKESGKLISISEADAKKVLAELTRRGEMVFEIGPAGRHGSAHCWRLKGALDTLAHLGAPSSETPIEEKVRGCAPPVRGAAPASAPSDGSEGSLGSVSAPSAPDDGIPF